MPEQQVDGRPAAEVYVDLALAVIRSEGPTIADRQRLRDWWRDEADHREEYGLSPEQVEQLLDECRAVAQKLPEVTGRRKPRKRKKRRTRDEREPLGADGF